MRKVSILVPVYGVENYIEKCATSLFGQTYENIEYVFVNDCTKDSSIDVLKSVLKEYPNRREQVRILNHDRNRGLAAARNTALDACTGDYIWHVDSDDWIEINAVEKLVNKAEQNKSDIIIFDNYNVLANKTILCKADFNNKELYISNILLHTTPGSVWNKFFNAEFYRKSGIRSIEGLNHGEDYVIIPKLLHKAKVIDVLEEPLYYYNLTNQGSYTRNISLESIKNVHQAYISNMEYFLKADDNDKFKDVIKVLPLRSMLALIKTAKKDRYNDIIKCYPECMARTWENISIIDKVILFLLKTKMYSILSAMIRVYKYMM